jgi:hypothetical protein
MRIAKELEGTTSTAGEIARRLKVSKSEVNSCLYKGKDIDFKADESQPPKWIGCRPASRTQSKKAGLLHRNLEGTITIDFSGGYWELEIQMAEMSRNDPIAIVEKVGPRKRLVVVSHNVVSTREQKFQETTEGLPDSVIATAAALLAWEIFQEGEWRDFDFARAVDDILLSIAAQSR